MSTDLGGIHCPRCTSGTYVKDSRPQENYVYRRRVCKSCGHRLTTRETELEVLSLAALFDQAQALVCDLEATGVQIKDALSELELLPPAWRKERSQK